MQNRLLAKDKLMKIFITGGTGFIGSHLVPKLIPRGHRLLLLSRRTPRKRYGNSVRFIKGNLHSPKIWEGAVRKFKPDAIIHLAWEGIEARDFGPDMSLANLIASLRLIAFAAEIGCKKFLSTGSCWEYGVVGGRVKESDILQVPNHVPAFITAKRAVRDMGEQFSIESGMRFLWARLFFVYGPGQRSESLIPHLAHSIKDGVEPDIQNKSGGNDFIYVGDVAEALLEILEKSKKQRVVYNIGSGHLIGVGKVVREVHKNFHFTVPRWCFSRVRPKGFYASIAKIKREIRWSPKTSLPEGIRKTLIYYQNQ